MTYEKLGWKTFWIFVLEHGKWMLMLGLLDLASYLFFGGVTLTRWLLWAFIISILITVIISWLEYSRYEFMLDEDAFKMKRGVLNHEELAIPYRQVQNVDIERSWFFQLVGVSKIVILTAGHLDTGETHVDTEGIVPVINRALAERLQTEILHRAGVQKIVT